MASQVEATLSVALPSRSGHGLCVPADGPRAGGMWADPKSKERGFSSFLCSSRGGMPVGSHPRGPGHTENVQGDTIETVWVPGLLV